MKPKHSTNMDQAKLPEKRGGDLAKSRRPSPNKVSPASQQPPEKAMDSVYINLKKGEDPNQRHADVKLGEYIAPTFATLKFARGIIGEVSLENAMHSILNSVERVTNQNNLAGVEGILVTQAYSLNLIFSECISKSALNAGQYFEASQRYFAMALQAQNQCRMTLETLSNIKNPPVIYAKQTNIANGPQQVNNGMMPSRAHTDENKNPPSKVLEQGNEQRMDTGTQGQSGEGDSKMETVAVGNRT